MANRSSVMRVALLTSLLLTFALAFLSTEAEAKREVSAVCKWFGRAPTCSGSCPAGWTQTRRSKVGDGQRCFTGSKVRCCDFREHCVSDYDPTYNPNATRVVGRVVQCQRCVKYGENCNARGGFNTACKRYEWYDCKKLPPPLGHQSKKGVPGPGNKPIEVPDPAHPDPPKPQCVAPHIQYPNGVCGCPEGLRGANCDQLIVR